MSIRPAQEWHVFSFFKKKPSFEELYQRAVASTDPQTMLSLMQQAIAAAGTNFDQGGVAMITMGDVLLQVAAQTGDAGLRDRGRASAAQGFTMISEARRERLAPDIKRLLGFDQGLPLPELVSACWEIDAVDKLRQDDVQGMLTALQGATSTLSVAYGRDNPRMIGPMWRAAARLNGTSVAAHGGLAAELADRAGAIVDKGGAAVDDELWTLHYQAVGAAVAHDLVRVRERLTRMLAVAEAAHHTAMVESARHALAGLDATPVELRLRVAAEEVEEMEHRRSRAARVGAHA